MSEHLLKILASELETIRIQCCNANCGVIVEVPWHRLRHTFGRYQCPVCQSPFQIAGAKETPNWLIRLQEALEGLRQSEQVQVQFVIPEKKQP